MGVSAVILGSVSIVVWFVNPFVGIPFGVASIILACKEKRRLSMSGTGLSLGIIGSILSIYSSIYGCIFPDYYY